MGKFFLCLNHYTSRFLLPKRKVTCPNYSKRHKNADKQRLYVQCFKYKTNACAVKNNVYKTKTYINILPYRFVFVSL